MRLKDRERWRNFKNSHSHFSSPKVIYKMLSHYFLSVTIKRVQTWPDWNMSGIKHYIKKEKNRQKQLLHKSNGCFGLLRTMDQLQNLFKMYRTKTAMLDHALLCCSGQCFSDLSFFQILNMLLLHVKIVTVAFIMDNITVREKVQIEQMKIMRKGNRWPPG